MSPFAPAIFFDLTECPFADIFEGCEQVWEALPKIAPYLASMKLGEIGVSIPKETVIVNPGAVYIGPGTVVEAGAYIQGPCWIGAGSQIRQGAYIRGNVITGEGCVIGHATEVKNSFLLNEAKAAHFAYVGDSLLGNGVNLGAGTKLANLKLDSRPVCFYHEKKRVETGLRKFGAILGDGAQTGCNSVTNPGTLMGKGAICYPCVAVTGFVPAGGRVCR